MTRPLPRGPAGSAAWCQQAGTRPAATRNREPTIFTRHILALAAALLTTLAITGAAADAATAASPQIRYHTVRAAGTGAVRILASADVKWFLTPRCAVTDKEPR